METVTEPASGGLNKGGTWCEPVSTALERGTIIPRYEDGRDGEQMATCVPVRDMKDTAAFARLVRESPEPVTVTKNGYSEFVVMRSEDYELMREEVAKARIVRILANADSAYERGEYVDGPEYVGQLRETYGL